MNVSNCIVCTKNACHFTHRNPIQFRSMCNFPISPVLSINRVLGEHQTVNQLHYGGMYDTIQYDDVKCTTAPKWLCEKDWLNRTFFGMFFSKSGWLRRKTRSWKESWDKNEPNVDGRAKRVHEKRQCIQSHVPFGKLVVTWMRKCA